MLFLLWSRLAFVSFTTTATASASYLTPHSKYAPARIINRTSRRKIPLHHISLQYAPSWTLSRPSSSSAATSAPNILRRCQLFRMTALLVSTKLMNDSVDTKGLIITDTSETPVRPLVAESHSHSLPQLQPQPSTPLFQLSNQLSKLVMGESDGVTVFDWKKTLINSVILCITLGYAVHTVLDVDHGMTRGWTQSEIAMRIPLDNWASYETSLQEQPIFTKTLINVVIYLLGDWLSQTIFQKKNILDFDPFRTLRNGFIGLCFGPLVHEYYQFSDSILPVEAGLTNRLCKILMDQTIYLTVKCSIYIMAVGLLAGEDFETAQDNVKSRIKGIVTTAWKFWPLVHCVTYSVIPARHRILWVNCVDLIWSAILASMSNDAPGSEDPEPEESILPSSFTATSQQPSEDIDTTIMQASEQNNHDYEGNEAPSLLIDSDLWDPRGSLNLIIDAETLPKSELAPSLSLMEDTPHSSNLTSFALS